MTKDEMKNRISMALKDPTLQQCFEIICKNLEELEKENLYYKDIVETNTAEWEEQGQRVVALEKENAELKNERNAFKIYSDGAELDAINLNDQLTKAKKLLKRVVTDFHNMDCVSVHISKTIAEAEQFLNGE